MNSAYFVSLNSPRTDFATTRLTFVELGCEAIALNVTVGVSPVFLTATYWGLNVIKK